MKIITKLTLSFLLLSNLANAIKLGSLDTSFSQDGNTDGWALYNELDTDPNHDLKFTDVLVDSQGRIIVAVSNNYDVGNNIVYGAEILRYLPNGSLDTSFGFNGSIILPYESNSENSRHIKMDLNSIDGIIIAYSYNPNSDSGMNIVLHQYNSSGTKLSEFRFGFDFGTTPSRRDDNLKDLIYIHSLSKVAIVAEIDRSTVGDTDFGIALLDMNQATGGFTLDSNFSGDGKDACFFDQDINNTTDIDTPSAITYDKDRQTLIVGGSTFEGSGTTGNGWNMAFCEFNLQGDELRKWSTLGGNIEFEQVTDVQYGVDESNIPSLYVAATVDGPNNNTDLYIARYQRNVFTSDWGLDLGFGNGNGFNTVGLSMLIIGDTDDETSELFLESDGSILLSGNGFSTSSGFSMTSLVKFTQEGEVYISWGIGEGIANNIIHQSPQIFDFVNAVAEDPTTGEIYVVGSVQASRHLGFIANMHNDMIFGNSFD